VEEVPIVEEPILPRWAQFLSGLALLPIAALSVVGAISIFGIPKVQGDPLLQLFTGAIVLLCAWTALLAIRLLLGRRGKHGLFGPLALRMTAIAVVGFVIVGAITGAYVAHPVRGAALAIVYAFVAVRLWQLAARRAAMPPNTSLERPREG
jgi:hypothetical protein